MKGRKHVIAAAAPDADGAVGALYKAHYESLVRLTALAAGCDPGTAEQVVQEAFVAMHQRWRRLGDPTGALFTCAGLSSTGPGRRYGIAAAWMPVHRNRSGMRRALTAKPLPGPRARRW